MLTVKEAVNRAFKFIHEAYADKTLHQLELEEVELSEDENHWFVTLGFSTPSSSRDAIETLVGTPRSERKYKIFKINAETGEIKSMKIRETNERTS